MPVIRAAAAAAAAAVVVVAAAAAAAEAEVMASSFRRKFGVWWTGASRSIAPSTVRPSLSSSGTAKDVSPRNWLPPTGTFASAKFELNDGNDVSFYQQQEQRWEVAGIGQRNAVHPAATPGRFRRHLVRSGQRGRRIGGADAAGDRDGVSLGSGRHRTGPGQSNASAGITRHVDVSDGSQSGHLVEGRPAYRAAQRIPFQSRFLTIQSLPYLAPELNHLNLMAISFHCGFLGGIEIVSHRLGCSRDGSWDWAFEFCAGCVGIERRIRIIPAAHPGRRKRCPPHRQSGIGRRGHVHVLVRHRGASSGLERLPGRRQPNKSQRLLLPQLQRSHGSAGIPVAAQAAPPHLQHDNHR